MGYERYVDYALDVPMYFVYRDGDLSQCRGREFPRLHGRQAAAIAGLAADHEGLVGSSDHDLPGSPAQELSRNARRRFRPVAHALRACRRFGRVFSTTRPRSMAPGIWSRIGPPRSARILRDAVPRQALQAEDRRPLRSRCGEGHAGAVARGPRGSARKPAARARAKRLSSMCSTRSSRRAAPGRGTAALYHGVVESQDIYSRLPRFCLLRFLLSGIDEP